MDSGGQPAASRISIDSSACAAVVVAFSSPRDWSAAQRFVATAPGTSAAPGAPPARADSDAHGW